MHYDLCQKTYNIKQSIWVIPHFYLYVAGVLSLTGFSAKYYLFWGLNHLHNEWHVCNKSTNKYCIFYLYFTCNLTFINTHQLDASLFISLILNWKTQFYFFLLVLGLCQICLMHMRLRVCPPAAQRQWIFQANAPGCAWSVLNSLVGCWHFHFYILQSASLTGSALIFIAFGTATSPSYKSIPSFANHMVHYWNTVIYLTPVYLPGW